MINQITIDRYDDEGLFGVIVEGRTQSPILLEAEGINTSFEAAEAMAKRIWAGGTLRYCIVRLVPVAGNELLPLDMQRMQK